MGLQILHGQKNIKLTHFLWIKFYWGPKFLESQFHSLSVFIMMSENALQKGKWNATHFLLYMKRTCWDSQSGKGLDITHILMTVGQNVWATRWEENMQCYLQTVDHNDDLRCIIIFERELIATHSLLIMRWLFESWKRNVLTRCLP